VFSYIEVSAHRSAVLSSAAFGLLVFGQQPAEPATMRKPLRASAGRRLRPARFCEPHLA